MKATVTVTLDEDLIREVRKKGINMSGTINNLLRDLVKPEKVNLEKENRVLEVVKFGKGLNLNGDLSILTFDNLHLSADQIWRRIKEEFNPDFSLYDYIEIRKKFREKFNIPE